MTGMDSLVDWVGFAGVWLLFAGPLFQANVELDAEAEAMNRMREAGTSGPRPTRSRWWWLFPPARAFQVAEQRRVKEQAIIEAMLPEDQDSVKRYLRTARGWMLVGLGAWLIAVHHTFGFGQERGWPREMTLAAVAGMTLLMMSLGQPGPRRARGRRGARASS